MKRALLLLSLAACEDALDRRLAIIDQPRVLAVVSEPAEAKPGAQVAYHAVLASPDGPLGVDPHWAFCTASKPPTEDNAVATPCTLGDQLVDLGTASMVTAALPKDGCILFGPDTPPGGFRPRDADSTGGYYQPIRVDAADLLAFGLSRITCKLPTAPSDVAHDYDLHYVANANPVLDPIGITTAPASSDVTLTASWPADSVESYLYYDPQSQHLITRREAMRVSWFATGGSIDVDASAVTESSDATRVSTTWHTPPSGTATLWFVLRDSRGGSAVQTATLRVQ